MTFGIWRLHRGRWFLKRCARVSLSQRKTYLRPVSNLLLFLLLLQVLCTWWCANWLSLSFLVKVLHLIQLHFLPCCRRRQGRIAHLYASWKGLFQARWSQALLFRDSELYCGIWHYSSTGLSSVLLPSSSSLLWWQASPPERELTQRGRV